MSMRGAKSPLNWEVRIVRFIICAAILLVATPHGTLLAQPAAPSKTPTHAAAKAPYNTNETDIGTLLDDPAARAIVDKHLQGFASSGQMDAVRGMTLKALQQYAPDKISDQALTEIDMELAKLTQRKK
jgi:para-nitrobenzyl esterase